MDGHVETQVPADVQETPLTLAAYSGQIDMAKILIKRGEKIDETNGKQYTPLMQAARKGHKEMVTLLVNHGAKINAQTN
ncbi:Ankyrin repeat domain-containing protein 17 [Formica fusca]